MPSYSGVWTLPAQMQAKANLQWPQGPGAPTSVSATAGDTQATISFTAPTFTGVPPGITGYRAISSPGGFTATGASSPLTVTGLTNDTSYTFSVDATNGVQYGPSGTSNSVTPSLPQRGLFGGGFTGSNTNVIDYVLLTSAGNATDFGDLTRADRYVSACSSTTRGVWAGGRDSGGNWVNTIDYVTIQSTGNATDFGDLNGTQGSPAGCSSSTRGLFGGPAASGSNIKYITIASTGNATDFGSLTVARNELAACASSTRGVFAGGGSSNVIDYVTINSTGNATDFGDLVYARSGLCGFSNATRGVFAGGDTSASKMDYITIASTGNAIDFGDLGVNKSQRPAGAANQTTGVIAGGFDGSSYATSIRQITIATTGNATSFGNLTVGRSMFAGCSNAQGGL